MKNITTANFETEVLAASASTPVLVDFWASWCGPCQTLGPMLEALEQEYDGRFVLAKIDADQEQQLSAAFGIRSLPTCVLMIEGKPVDGFSGALPKGKIKEFLDRHLPPALKAEPEPSVDDSQLDPEALLLKRQQAAEQDPSNERARFDWVAQLLKLGRVPQAQAAFAPVATQAATSQLFLALKHHLSAIEFAALYPDIASATSQLNSKIAANKRDFSARYELAQLFMSKQRWTEAMDELLEILMRDKAWGDELARKTMISVLQLMAPPPVKVADGQIPPEDPVVLSYRRRLSSVVLS